MTRYQVNPQKAFFFLVLTLPFLKKDDMKHEGKRHEQEGQDRYQWLM